MYRLMKLYHAVLICTGCINILPSTSADIVWSGEQNLSVYEQYIDLNNDSVVDLFVTYHISGNNDLLPYQNGQLTTSVGGSRLDGSNRVLINPQTDNDAALPIGTVISSSPDSSRYWDGGRFFSAMVAEWDDTPPTPDTQWRGLLGENGNAYIGITFDINNATHYGWVNIALGPDVSEGFPVPIIKDWAYESDPDTAIMAGAIPEPSTGILAMVGSLALLMRARALRRR